MKSFLVVVVVDVAEEKSVVDEERSDEDRAQGVVVRERPAVTIPVAVFI